MGPTPIDRGGTTTIFQEDDTSLEDRIKEKLTLAGNLCAKCSVGFEVLKTTVGRI